MECDSRYRVTSLGLLMLLSWFSAFGAVDSYSFRLHKFELPIGGEIDSVSRKDGMLQIDSTFEFTDRGTKVPLRAQLRCSEDYTVSSFTISGSTSRSSTINIGVTVNRSSATVRDGKASYQARVPHGFFTVAGYAPVVLQETMIRYWEKHGKPTRLTTLPLGAVEITDRGADTFTVGGSRIRFRRHSVRGLVWGLETLWMDDRDQLAAVITRDAEFDHFEAVRDGYEPALGDFISAAARDSTASLEQISRAMTGRLPGPLAITGATLIDGLNPPISPATIVTSSGKIAAAGPSASVAIPAGARHVDAKGKYIIPGLWDMHAHYEQAEWGPIYLAAGVTTVRDVANEFGFITATRDAIIAGKGLGPRLLLAGIVDGDGPIAIGVQRVNSAADAAAWVKRYHEAGFQQMKIYSSVKPEMVKAICETAHALGMTVTGHIPLGMSLVDGINAGMDQVNHISYLIDALLPKDIGRAPIAERISAVRSLDVNSDAARQLIDFLKQHHILIDDTAVIYELGTRAADEPAAVKEPGIVNVAPELQEQFNGMGGQGDALLYRRLRWNKAIELIGALHKAGVTFVAGTDQAVPGYSVYREMEIYVEAGFTPLEALQAATIIPARVMGVDTESGSVETGKRADFDILYANPLENIRNVRSVGWVVANGTLYETQPLWRSVGFK